MVPSDLTIAQYHELSDYTMDTLLEQLEEIVDADLSKDYEVEYSVCTFLSLPTFYHDSIRLGWCFDAEDG